jgi:hypothetical protein
MPGRWCPSFAGCSLLCGGVAPATVSRSTRPMGVDHADQEGHRGAEGPSTRRPNGPCPPRCSLDSRASWRARAGRTTPAGSGATGRTASVRAVRLTAALHAPLVQPVEPCTTRSSARHVPLVQPVEPCTTRSGALRLLTSAAVRGVVRSRARPRAGPCGGRSEGRPPRFARVCAIAKKRHGQGVAAHDGRGTRALSPVPGERGRAAALAKVLRADRRDQQRRAEGSVRQRSPS